MPCARANPSTTSARGGDGVAVATPAVCSTSTSTARMIGIRRRFLQQKLDSTADSPESKAARGGVAPIAGEWVREPQARWITRVVSRAGLIAAVHCMRRFAAAFDRPSEQERPEVN